MGPIRNDVYIPPTTDPRVPGAMWNNGGVLVFCPGIIGGSDT